jgi:hypothetical protein
LRKSLGPSPTRNVVFSYFTLKNAWAPVGESGPKVDADTQPPESSPHFAYCYEATSTNSRQGWETRKYLTEREMK